MNTRILCLLLIALTSLGCKREDPNPELRDPIYNDLLSERAMHTKMKEEIIKKIEVAEKELAKTRPRTMERKNAANDLEKLEHKLIKSNEMIEYYDIRAKLRYTDVRRSYKQAFLSGDEWPNPEEHKAYLVNKRLLNASRMWDDRVPKSRMQQVDRPNAEKKEDATGSEKSKESGKEAHAE
jgi:hypothetical protein